MRKNFKKVIAIAGTMAMMATSVHAQAKQDTYPNKVNTHIGELVFDHGIPTEDTSKKLYYELDYHRAVQRYLLAVCTVDL